MNKISVSFFLSLFFSLAAMGGTPAYDYATQGVACFKKCSWTLLLDKSNFGGDEIEIIEMVLAAGTSTQSHPHGAIEIIYVVSGEVGHEVNGEYHLLKPGMLGVVRKGDSVRHVVSEEDAKVLVIWLPGGEARRLLDFDKATHIH